MKNTYRFENLPHLFRFIYEDISESKAKKLGYYLFRNLKHCSHSQCKAYKVGTYASSNLSMRRECRFVDVSRMSICRCVENVENIQKTLENLKRQKKKSHVTILKMNSLHSLYLICRVMNSRHIDSTCRHQFILDITNSEPIVHNHNT